MRLKLDENVDARLGRILRDGGHGAATVRDQRLRGAPDPALYAHCISDGRILVPLDLDFSNVIRYPPERTPGLIVLRGPNDLFPTVRMLILTLVGALVGDTPAGRLWIVEPGRIRIHEAIPEAEL